MGPGAPRAGRAIVAALTIAAALLGVRAARAQILVPADFTDAVVVDRLDKPVAIAFLPDGRFLVTEQFAARIRLVVNDAFAAVDPAAVVDSVETGYGEQGLLGIAVDPGFPARPYVYVQYDVRARPWIRIARFTALGDLAWTGEGSLTLDPASRRDVLLAPSTAVIHNGGTLRFGPDGMLYSSLGDDGWSCHAQDLTILRGKILRLDVSRLPAGPGGPPPLADVTPADNPFVAHPHPHARLVWAYGLRNPARFHVDAATGALWIGDVGETEYEEVDFAPAGGMNFGWPHYEGPLRRADQCAGADSTTFVLPEYAYGRCEEGCDLGLSVIAGPVYRRPPGATRAFPPEYEGDAFFTDYYRGFLRRMSYDGSAWTFAPPVPGQPAALNWGDPYGLVCDFAVAPDGRLHYVQQFMPCCPARTGIVGRIEYVGALAAPAPAARAFALAAAPSPARDRVTVTFALSAPSRVSLGVYDAGGRRVRDLVADAFRGPGAHEARWDLRDARGARVAPGVYVVRLRAGDRAAAVRVAVMG